jgi:hypothetical protein
MFQYDVAPIYVAEVSQPFDKPAKIGTFFLGATRVPRHSNSRNFSCLLRKHCLRPSGRRAAEKRNEARRCMCPRRRRSQWLSLALCDRAAGKQSAPSAATQCPRWVKLRRTQCVQMFFRVTPESGHCSIRSACLKRVESRCDAVALGSNISVSAPFVRRCLTGSTMSRFHTPLIEPDRRISRIRLSEKGSRLRTRKTARPRCKADQP